MNKITLLLVMVAVLAGCVDETQINVVELDGTDCRRATPIRAHALQSYEVEDPSVDRWFLYRVGSDVVEFSTCDIELEGAQLEFSESCDNPDTPENEREVFVDYQEVCGDGYKTYLTGRYADQVYVRVVPVEDTTTYDAYSIAVDGGVDADTK
tara:strand:- start:5832 stop:6290 length:459 start_codon:yes stop_codon:yes gene_type:complete